MNQPKRTIKSLGLEGSIPRKKIKEAVINESQEERIAKEFHETVRRRCLEHHLDVDEEWDAVPAVWRYLLTETFQELLDRGIITRPRAQSKWPPMGEWEPPPMGEWKPSGD